MKKYSTRIEISTKLMIFGHCHDIIRGAHSSCQLRFLMFTIVLSHCKFMVVFGHVPILDQHSTLKVAFCLYEDDKTNRWNPLEKDTCKEFK